MDDDLTVLRCWACNFVTLKHPCYKCAGTGQVFWADGRAYPYTPKGEEAAKAALRICAMRVPEGGG